jgi:hypothetical protein
MSEKVRIQAQLEYLRSEANCVQNGLASGNLPNCNLSSHILTLPTWNCWKRLASLNSGMRCHRRKNRWDLDLRNAADRLGMNVVVINHDRESLGTY